MRGGREKSVAGLDRLLSLMIQAAVDDCLGNPLSQPLCQPQISWTIAPAGAAHTQLHDTSNVLVDQQRHPDPGARAEKLQECQMLGVVGDLLEVICADVQ